MLTFLFAENTETGEIFEIMNIEMFQGVVAYMEVMDAKGAIQGLDQPYGYKYHLKHKKGDESDKQPIYKEGQ